MTHDELVKFAAVKVGGEVCNPTGNELCVKTFFTTIDPARCSGWHIHDLTSPDLFFKGLAAAYRELSTFIYTDDILMQKGEHEVIKPFMQVEDIPLTFWQCWAEVEGGTKCHVSQNP